eukprot:scaffold18886_cov39-Phaeocystis_antarctica.AAC.1
MVHCGQAAGKDPVASRRGRDRRDLQGRDRRHSRLVRPVSSRAQAACGQSAGQGRTAVASRRRGRDRQGQARLATCEATCEARQQPWSRTSYACRLIARTSSSEEGPPAPAAPASPTSPTNDVVDEKRSIRPARSSGRARARGEAVAKWIHR